MPPEPVGLTFRPLGAGDLAAVHRLHSDPATNRHNPYGASPDLQASERMLKEWLDHWDRLGFGYELAFADDDLAGIGGARSDQWKGAAVRNLYWRLLPEFQGRGLSALVAARALEMASRTPGVPLIVARMRPENEASARVAAALGMHRRPDLDGELDGYSWIIYADRAAAG